MQKKISDIHVTFIFLIGKGPIHTFNGHAANFYISTGQSTCSVDDKQDADIDAAYFCSSFYGPNFIVLGYEIGKYEDSGNLGYKMHKGTDCSNDGEDIEETDCSGVKCKIWDNDAFGHSGLFNIVCIEQIEA